MEKAITKRKVLGADFWLRNIRYIIFFGLIIIFAAISPKFYSWNNISNLLLSTAPYGIAVVGMTFIILTAGIDLSVGAVVLLTGSMAVYAANAGWGFVPSLIVAMLTGFGAGALNGFLISRFKIVPFLATLATMSFFKGFTLMFGNSGYIMCNDPVIQDVITQQNLLGIPVIVYLFAAIVVIAQVILKKTQFGWHLYAVGNNAAAAEKIGIKVRNIKFAVYALSGLLVGVSGFMQMGMIGAVTTNFGTGQEFTIISATVLGGISLFGGKGSIWPGAIVGIFIFMIIENGMVIMGANPYAYTIVRGIVIFVAIMLDSIRNKGELR